MKHCKLGGACSTNRGMKMLGISNQACEGAEVMMHMWDTSICKVLVGNSQGMRPHRRSKSG